MGAIMGIAGAGLGVVGSFNQAYDEVAAGKLKAAEAADNQKLADQAADDALARGGQDAGQARMKGSQLAAAQSVAYANSGVDATVGTAANVQADTAAQAELEAQMAKNNAAREAWGFKRYGLKYGQQAQLEAAQGSAKATGTALTGVGRGLASAGQLYSDYKKGGG